MLFILHADHEQNCSTSAVRSVGSSQVDPYSAVAAGVAALYGPLHGGANEAVLRMLRRIETKENIPDFIKGVKDGNERLMGFGHRVYKNYDPRAKIIKKAVRRGARGDGHQPAARHRARAREDRARGRLLHHRKLYPNVDFYSGLIYEALGMPMEMFPVMFAIGRTSGWIAQWLEMIDDPEQKIARPRQIYTGERDARLRPDRSSASSPRDPRVVRGRGAGRSRSARVRASSASASTCSTDGARRGRGARPRAGRDARTTDAVDVAHQAL